MGLKVMIKLILKGGRFKIYLRILLNFDTLVSGVKITAWGKLKYGEMVATLAVEKLPRER